jgi:hypothetical protein
MTCGRLVMLVALSALLLTDCVPSQAPVATPALVQTDTSAFRRATTPTAGSTPTPAFWPTGMPPPTRGPEAAKPEFSTDEQTCQQADGWWGPALCPNLDAKQYCWEVPTTDAGRRCSDSSECEGWCDANLRWDEARAMLDGARDRGGVLMTGTCSPVAGERSLNMMWVQDGRLKMLYLSCR